jgi:cell division protein FtsB
MASQPRTPNRGPGSRRPRTRTSDQTRRDGPPPRRTRATGRAAVLALVLLVLVISYASSLRAWLDQRAEIADVEAEIAAAEHRVDELRQTKQRWHDEAYVRRMARERFGWVLPGEVGYRVIDEDGETVGDTPQLDDPAGESESADQPAWYDRMWGSVVAAGEPLPETRDESQRPPKESNDTESNNTVIKPEPRRR